MPIRRSKCAKRTQLAPKEPTTVAGIMAPSTAAAQLKEQGNALFINNDFVLAHDKYTEAIAIDGQNAVLHANRSACSLGMGKYLDALRDARQATKLDPTYAKGWSRLATAYDAGMEFMSAVRAWQKAIDALPKADLTPGERHQQEQYMASLQKSQQRQDAFTSSPFPGLAIHASEKMPWQAAEEMLPELHAAGPAGLSSSAYVIYHANQDFEEGVGHMNMLKRVPIQGAPNGYSIVGHTEGLTCITNGLMRDFRVFRIDSKWLNKFSDQVSFETDKRRAWTSDSLESVQTMALKRLKKDGWNDMRLALAVVVRAWLMYAILDSELKQAPHVGVERLKEILQLLHWGCQVWRNVSKDDKGAIFQDTLVTGIKAIYLRTLMSAYAKAAAADKRACLDDILHVSREILEDRSSSTEPVDPGFVSSFSTYTTAEASAAFGYCFLQMAKSAGNQKEEMSFYSLAIRMYNQAALMLPDDDEKHCWYLNYTVDPMLRTGIPKDTILGTVGKIRKAMPKMQRIWGNSALAKQGRDAMIEATLRIAEAKLS